MPNGRVSAAFSSYRKRHPARPPKLDNLKDPDELRLIAPSEGLMQFSVSPASSVAISLRLPRSRHEMNRTKYLWAVGIVDLPYALENGQQRAVLARGYLAHTNLTGGADAHSAGELWFLDSGTLVINGGSSRYLPRSLLELRDVAIALKGCGYKVGHMGYDKGAGGFSRFVRGNPTWV